jgi:hypothetical protein
MDTEKQKNEKSGELVLAMCCTAVAGSWVLHFLNSNNITLS